MVDSTSQLVAHTPPPGGEWHLLTDHLTATADLAADFAAAFDAADLARQAGLLHDIGKASPAFQSYLAACYREPGRRHPTTDHKGAGTLEALKVWEPLAFLIDGHHGGLRDQVELGTRLKELRTSEKAREGLAVARRAGLIPDGLDPSSTSAADKDELVFFLRMLFSALVDADHTDTARHQNPGQVPAPDHASVQDLAERLAADQERFAIFDGTTPATERDVAEVRNEVYWACANAADLPPGFFSLTVPTGGGKTRSGLAFALNHAARHGLRRVIVALPYLAITEQTSGVFRDFLGDAAVLEHYSGAGDREPVEGRPDEAGAQDAVSTWRRLAASTWDAPVIVTTTVQLFESLFANKPSRCRKLHRIAKSVIILDEVQSLPAPLLAPILATLRLLVDHYDVSVVFSTATQPALGDAPGFTDLRDRVREIAPDPAALFRRLRRVRYSWPEPREQWSWDRAAEAAVGSPQSLTIVNTRADALKLLDAVSMLDLDDPPLHLSTLLCGAHRKDVLDLIRQRLRNGEPCRVVSTQVVEAGVDLDFPLVLRALGPLDRIVQAAGRCNRNGRLAGLGDVIVFRPAEGGVPPGPYRTAAGITEGMLASGGVDPDDPETFRRYFADLFGTVTLDAKGIAGMVERLAFETIAREFRMIDEDGVSVLVEYMGLPEAGGDGIHQQTVRELVGAFEQASTGRAAPGRARQLLQRAQPYFVSLRQHEIVRAARENLVTELTTDVWHWRGGYDPVRGLQWDSLAPTDLIV